MRCSLKRIYKISLTVMILFTALCLMGACLLIWRSGSFTPEKVSAALRLLAIPLGLTGLLILIGVLFGNGTASSAAAVIPEKARPFPRLPWIRLVFGILVLIFIICGLLSGGTAEVLAKAANLCAECIGLG